MSELEAYGVDATSGREMRFLELESLDDWPDAMDLDPPHFVLLLACDAARVKDPRLRDVARRAVEQGMVYLCAWGPECDRVETIFDEAGTDTVGGGDPEGTILTESDGEEPLGEVVRNAVRLVAPATDYEESCATTLVVTVGNESWAEEVRALLANPELMEDVDDPQDREDEEDDDDDLEEDDEFDDDEDDDEEDDEEEEEEDDDED
jgi:hypothetical protein